MSGRVRGKRRISHGRRVLFSLILLGLMMVTVLVAGELAVRIISPGEYMRPRYEFSEDYGLVLFKNARMVHALPGVFEFHYTVNENGHRGEAVAVSDSYPTTNIVVLGDSYAFGMGVPDGKEFPYRLGQELGAGFNVINLGNPGWGLTQEIRRYYEFGRLYQPRFVVLQFCGNDPEDNFGYRVTTLAPDDSTDPFEFKTSRRRFGWVKKYLSRSIIQESQLYNFLRRRVYTFFKNLQVRSMEAEVASESGSREEAPQEQFYDDLLERFAGDLSSDGVRLIVISINGQLDEFPMIKRKVLDLDAAGLLDYVEVEPWFANVKDYGSPEGHLWGIKAHDIVAVNLARVIRSRPAG